jgi:hypothetical protein
VSRTTFNQGIAVPGDPRHVMFVWFDALELPHGPKAPEDNARFCRAPRSPRRQRHFPPPARHALAGAMLLAAGSRRSRSSRMDSSPTAARRCRRARNTISPVEPRIAALSPTVGVDTVRYPRCGRSPSAKTRIPASPTSSSYKSERWATRWQPAQSRLAVRQRGLVASLSQSEATLSESFCGGGCADGGDHDEGPSDDLNLTKARFTAIWELLASRQRVQEGRQGRPWWPLGSRRFGAPFDDRGAVSVVRRRLGVLPSRP